MVEDYESAREIELNGGHYRGRSRVMNGTVIVDFKGRIKFAGHDMNGPDAVARWLLTDLSRRASPGSGKRPVAGTIQECLYSRLQLTVCTQHFERDTSLELLLLFQILDGLLQRMRFAELESIFTE